MTSYADNQQKVPISPTLRKLSINGTASFPIKKHSSVRSCCQVVALNIDVKFKTHLDRKNEVIIVTRVQ